MIDIDDTYENWKALALNLQRIDRERGIELDRLRRTIKQAEANGSGERAFKGCCPGVTMRPATSSVVIRRPLLQLSCINVKLGRVSTQDDDVESTSRVTVGAALSVVSQPSAVKLVHRSGRVVHVFTGSSMVEDMRTVRDDLARYCGESPDSKRRLAREVEGESRNPWWAFWR